MFSYSLTKVSVAGKTLADFPDLVKQIDKNKHPGLEPKNVAAGSHKKIWWKCNKGPDHKWENRIAQRTSAKLRQCPFCSNRYVSVTNSLETLFPEIAKEWHPTKNGDLQSKDVNAHTHRKVWFKCNIAEDHEWKTEVAVRTEQGTGCRACANQQVSVTNSLASLYPEVAKEWHPTKNGEITPKEVMNASNKKYWWKCPQGPDHEWRSSIVQRTHAGSGCHA